MKEQINIGGVVLVGILCAVLVLAIKAKVDKNDAVRACYPHIVTEIGGEYRCAQVLPKEDQE